MSLRWRCRPTCAAIEFCYSATVRRAGRRSDLPSARGRKLPICRTHMFMGLSGSLLLVQRYLQAHPAPQHVILAISPQLYHFDNNLRRSRYFLWHAFNRPEERGFLRTYHPGMGQRDWLPAILDLQERVLEPFMSLVRHRLAAWRKRGPLQIPGGDIRPNPAAPVLYSSNAEGELEDQGDAEALNLTMPAVNVAALSRLCDLSRANRFQIHFLWPPMPDGVHKALATTGALSGLERKIRSIMAERCDLGGFVDLNERRTYLSASFQHDRLHLFGDGWEQRYASDLREYLGGLLHGSVADTTQ